MSTARLAAGKMSTERFQRASPRPPELINPAEEHRRYSDDQPSGGSVLGSKGEWRVASADASRWVVMDLGRLRCVHSVVLQCGSLRRTFSGWVTRLRVHYSTSDEMPAGGDESAWTPLGRDLTTDCSSDPAREHQLPLRVPTWLRHIKLTPIEWRSAGALSTGENLTTHISMRCAVLAGRQRAESETSDAAKLAQARTGLLDGSEGEAGSGADGSNALRCLFNLRRGCTVQPRTAAELPAELVADLELLPHAASPHLASPHPVGRLLSAHEAGSTAVRARMLLDDTWLDAAAFLDERGGDTGVVRLVGSTSTLAIRVEADAMAYAAVRGTRVGLAAAARMEEAAGTVVGVDEASGELIVNVDNTSGSRAFRGWSALHHGKASRGVVHAVKSLGRPADVVGAASVRYPAGTRLMVLVGGAVVDATVREYAGARHGNKHALRMEGVGVERFLDLNEVNHAPQIFESMGTLMRARRTYLDDLVSRGEVVEDAITGRKLLIEKQLLNISMATGDVRYIRARHRPRRRLPCFLLACLPSFFMLPLSPGSLLSSPGRGAREWRGHRPIALFRPRVDSGRRAAAWRPRAAWEAARIRGLPQ